MTAPPRPPGPPRSARPAIRPGWRPKPVFDASGRPSGVTVLALLNYAGGAISCLVGVAMFYVATEPDAPSPGLLQAVGVINVLLGALGLMIAPGLWHLRSYGRALQIATAGVGLLAIPFGTVISAFILAYLLKPGAKVVFSEKPFSQWSEWEVEEVEKFHRSRIRFVFIAVAGLLVVGVVGIVAAIAIPSLLRSRLVANEVSAIADIRALASAELAYASTNGGQYDTLECLLKPEECRAGSSLPGEPLLSEPFVPEKMGYRREFLPGPPSDPKDISFANLSRSSIQNFAVVAYPVRFGLTGVRSFCIDYTGRACVFDDGSQPLVVNGQCDPRCAPLP